MTGGGDLDPVALHAGNLARLADPAVVVAGYPGSGAALVGNILLAAGLPYLDPYTEVVSGDGRTTAAAPQRVGYRSRLAATDRLDRGGARRMGGPVFLKTHRYPAEFTGVPVRAVVLLVRDPRDAVHSYFRWRQGFSESGERGTFDEFLRRPGGSGLAPAADWAAFTSGWADRAGPVHPLRFEDLKHDPLETMRNLLAAVGVLPDGATLRAAVAASSFDAMRRHEDDRAAGTARVMRRGLVGEWREWCTPHLAAGFETPAVRQTAARFGYVV
ncbi:sulfotransferase domain-containing protein [Krasilnikovia sp. MM14-A1259]|uniref:sulfotransferase domain-containing protein n=1 Tax=Krasilnikovia sp. MM14-A1259 TaxID=3373539 RepID=UPI0038129DEF